MKGKDNKSVPLPVAIIIYVFIAIVLCVAGIMIWNFI